MRLSARVDYALRAAAELAVAGSRPVTAVQLAEAQQIPPKFLENILGQLRRSGLIRSQRGPEGGYWLARQPEQISLADIIRAIDGPLANVRGERPEHVDYDGAARSLQHVAAFVDDLVTVARGPGGPVLDGFGVVLARTTLLGLRRLLGPAHQFTW